MIELPTYWSSLPLGQLIITRKGKKPLKLSHHSFRDSIPYLDIEAIETNKFKQYADNLTTVISTEKDIFIVADGSRSGLVARGIVGAVGSTLLCITPIAIDVDFLYYFLQSKFEFLNKNTSGVSIPHLDQKIFLNMEIPLPPPNEQKLIAEELKSKLEQYQEDFKGANNELIEVQKYRRSVLEKAISGELTALWRNNNITKDMAIADLHSINPKADISELPMIHSVLPPSWIITDAKSICSKITDGEHNTPTRFPAGELLLSAKNIRDGYIDYSNVDFISKEDLVKLRLRCNPEKNDVLMVSVGATIGRTSVVKEDTLFALVRSVLLFKPLISGEFLMYCFQSPILQDVIRENSKGVAQAHLYITESNLLPIPFPCLKEQFEIVRVIKEHFYTSDILEQKTSVTLKRIDDLQRAIFQIAFSGQLTKNKAAQQNKTWFKAFLSLIDTERNFMKNRFLYDTGNKKNEATKLKNIMTIKKTIVEILDSTPKNEISVEEAWHQSQHYEIGNIEGFYEELEKTSKKNKSGKIVKWEFSNSLKNNVILKFK